MNENFFEEPTYQRNLVSTSPEKQFGDGMSGDIVGLVIIVNK